MFRKGKIAIIPIKGVITTEGAPILALFPWRKVMSSTEIIEFLEEVKRKPDTKAVLVQINSPGGTPFPCKEIAEKIKEIDKPTVAWVREYATSGAYWVASACQKIVAGGLSRIGSVGVVSIRPDFSELMRKFGIDVETMASGIFKTLGFPYRKISPEEREVLKQELDTIHKYFLEEISANRKLKKEVVKEISSGKIYFGSEAKELGLIDYLGGKKEAMELLSKMAKLKTYRIVDYDKRMGKPIGLLRKLIGGF